MISFCCVQRICPKQIYSIRLLLSTINYHTTNLHNHENKTTHDFKIVSTKPVANKKSGQQAAVSSRSFADFHFNASYFDYQLFCKLR